MATSSSQKHTISTTCTATEYKEKYGKKKSKLRAGSASQLERIPLRVFPTIINKIDDYKIVYEETSDRRSPQGNEFAGLTWEFKPELTLQGMDPRQCVDILTTTLEVHLPERRLGKPLLGSSISLEVQDNVDSAIYAVQPRDESKDSESETGSGSGSGSEGEEEGVPPPHKVRATDLDLIRTGTLVSVFLKKLLNSMKDCTELNNDTGKFLMWAILDYVTCFNVQSNTFKISTTTRSNQQVAISCNINFSDDSDDTIPGHFEIVCDGELTVQEGKKFSIEVKKAPVPGSAKETRTGSGQLAVHMIVRALSCSPTFGLVCIEGDSRLIKAEQRGDQIILSEHERINIATKKGLIFLIRCLFYITHGNIIS